MKIFGTLGLLLVSNTIMSFAWYAHLKKSGTGNGSWLLFILMSWGLAFFEYCFAVPANRIGFSAGMNVYQLKVLQEAIALAVFVPFALFYMGASWKWDYCWAFLCLLGAVFFVNREYLTGIT